ncbi:hypothetical protein C8J57DRAFT_1309173 [Mycena rebaudengoi]|nr:hypothetical protein C8J57DRAFT_1309173 [Mycena rebaudengoi]
MMSLPSIHEMFPEHLVPRPSLQLPARPQQRLRKSVPNFVAHLYESNYQSRPLSASTSTRSLYPPTSSSYYQPRPASLAIESGASCSSSYKERDGSEGYKYRAGSYSDLRDDAAEGDASDGGEGKKHVCPTCAKRFNRPSSLKIHANTHSGAQPFRCPHPSCGRQFNVNSNMRRHFRNHALASAYPHSRDPAFNPRARSRSRSSTPSLSSTSSASPTSPTSSASPTSASSTGSFAAYFSPPGSCNTGASPVSLVPPYGYPAERMTATGADKPVWTRESDVRSESWAR